MSVTGFNTSFLPEAMANTGFSAQVPANLQMTPTPAAPQAWYENPGFWSMIGKFGAAISPKDSWQRDLGLAAAGEAQARQYGAGMNKMIGPMLAGETGAPTSLSGAMTPPAMTSAVPPTPGVAPGTYPGVGPVVNPVQQGVNPFNDVPFSGGPSTPVLSQAEMMGLSPDQIKDVMGAAVEAKKFPLEVARINAGIDYTKASAEHMRMLNEETKRKNEENKIKESNFKYLMEGWKTGDKKKPAFIGDELVPILEAMGSDEATKLISEFVKLSKADNKKYTYHFNDKAGKGFAMDPETNLPATDKEGRPIFFDIPKSPDTETEGKPENWHYTQGYSTAFTNNYQTLLDAHYKKFGDREEAKRKLDETLGMVNQTTDPQKAESAKSYLLSLVPQAARIRILEEADAVAASLRAGTGLSGAYRRSTSQGANASPGMLENKAAPATTTAPVENKSLFDSLFNDSYSNVKVPTTGYFPKITEAAKAAGLRPGIAEAMAYVESEGNPNAKNPNSSARGLFQLIKGTAKEEGVDAEDPDQNIKGGVAYLAKASRKAGGDPFKTAVYYHDGINKDISKASPKGIEHARKVLSTLAKFGGLTPSEANRVVLRGTDKSGKIFTLFGDGRVE